MQFSLAPLVKKVREPQLQEIVEQLCSYTTQPGKEELRDIAGIGIIIFFLYIMIRTSYLCQFSYLMLP
jgi:hypothetical protein